MRWQCQCQWQYLSLIGQGRRVLSAVPAGATRWSRQPGERSLQPVAHHRQQDQEDQPESQADYKGEGRHGLQEQLQFYLCIYVTAVPYKLNIFSLLPDALGDHPRLHLMLVSKIPTQHYQVSFYPSYLSSFQAWTIWGTLDRWVALTYNNTEFFADTPFLYFSQVLLTCIYHFSLLIELDTYR